MMRFYKKCALLLGVVSTWGALTSAVSEDPFVLSGDYARALGAAADCSKDFVPIYSDEDRKPQGLFWKAGAELALPYRMDTTAHLAKIQDKTQNKTQNKEGKRRLYVNATGRATAVTSTIVSGPGTVGGKCNKTIISIPQIFTIGSPGGPVDGQPVYGPHGGKRALVAVRMAPEKQRQTGIVRAYHNGQPVPGAKVKIWGVGKGDYTVFHTMTPGHWHVYQQADPAPSFSLMRQTGSTFSLLPPGTPITDVIPATGELRFGVQPGYRGGIERLWVHRLDGAPDDTSSIDLMFTYNGQTLKHIGDLIPEGGGGNILDAKGIDIQRARATYPFFYTGATDRHKGAHYMQPQLSQSLFLGLRQAWEQDMSPAEKALAQANRQDPRAHWIQINDMALEYGGTFHVTNGNCTDLGSVPGGHHTHNIGDDFDVAMCYSNGYTRIPSKQPGCRSMNQSRLRAIIEDQLGGVLHIEDDHYHIRLPVPGLVSQSGAG